MAIIVKKNAPAAAPFSAITDRRYQIVKGSDDPGHIATKGGVSSSPGQHRKNSDSSSYFGGKGGVFRTIINLIPPHDTYIETHLGGGAVMRHKRTASLNIGIDIDPAVTRTFKLPGAIVKKDDATRFLKSYEFSGNEFVYCDPPYLLETRKGGKQYNFEYTPEQHIELLETLNGLPCMVMISGYYSDLYASLLGGWNSHSFEAQTRQGKAVEWIWFNYPWPKKLHDYSYLGTNFRDRERIKRKRQRWIERLLLMPVLERNAIVDGLMASGIAGAAGIASSGDGISDPPSLEVSSGDDRLHSL